ncbi:MAG: histidine kinase [Vulcanimicrobiaceae bacterium]
MIVQPREDAVLDLLVQALPHLRGGLRRESAEFTARLLFDYLQLDAAAVSSREEILAFVGAGGDHHLVGSPNLTDLTQRVLATGRPARAVLSSEIACTHPGCPLTSAIVVPLRVREEVVGALKLYRTRGNVIEDREVRVVMGLARLFSVYLEVAELDRRAALTTQAELAALRAQISPHFLFNALTTIAALTRTDAERAHDLILDFAYFFRQTLSHRNECVTLEEELEHVERYLTFEFARLGPRLKAGYDIDPRLRAATIPVLVVQPLVENAVGHGLVPRGGGTVVVRAAQEDGGYRVTVTDDGVGIPAERCAHVLERGCGSGLGIGLYNVHERLRGLFGLRSGLRVESTPGTGTSVSFWIPERT